MELKQGHVLDKKSAEALFLLVFPLAERNLFVALKQERFRDKTGKDHDAVKHIIRRMVAFIDHMHKKGVLHADLKPLNIMRMDGQWLAIDLDVVCEIGKDPVGSKSSSVYIPPEAINVDTKKDIAAVKSEKHRADNGLDYDLLIAHVSFDIWSLGVIMYQLLNNEVLPLFQAGQDDNLLSDKTRPDNLFVLADWPDEVKDRKLSIIEDPVARSLLSLMLVKDPSKRYNLEQISAHLFLSGAKGVAFPVRVPSKYHVSSPTESGATRTPPARLLYEELASRGVRVCLVGRRVSEGRRALGGGLLSGPRLQRGRCSCASSPRKRSATSRSWRKAPLPCDMTTYS